MRDLLRRVPGRRRDGQAGVLVQVSQGLHKELVGEEGHWQLSCSPGRDMSFAPRREARGTVGNHEACRGYINEQCWIKGREAVGAFWFWRSRYAAHSGYA